MNHSPFTIRLAACLLPLAFLTGCAEFGATGILGPDGALATAGGVAKTADTAITVGTNVVALVMAPVHDVGVVFQKLADATQPEGTNQPGKIVAVINKGATATATVIEKAETWIDKGLSLIAKPAKILSWFADKFGK